MLSELTSSLFFFFNDTATTEIYTLSLHDALPISIWICEAQPRPAVRRAAKSKSSCTSSPEDRKSTRLNSSHQIISYAVFCLKKKKANRPTHRTPHQPPSPPPTSSTSQSPLTTLHP